ncbi:MAG: ATP-binding cassette domain-containing protein, partial [Deltaproteobacteria bacterium]
MARGLSITNLSKTWNASGPAPVPAVRNLTLDVDPGEFVVLLGPSGCGKSSLLYIAAGLEEPTSGTITFDGLPITEPSPERSLIFQEAALFPWLSVRDNVGFGLSIRGGQPVARAERVEALSKHVGLGGVGDRRPDELSGGMRQRAALARALAMDPKVLLMDDCHLPVEGMGG